MDQSEKASVVLVANPPKIKARKSPFREVSALNINTGRINTMYFCKKCPFKQSKYANILAHIRTHTMEEPFSCEFCDRRFSVLANCKRHQ